jgi:hypothetical protein
MGGGERTGAVEDATNDGVDRRHGEQGDRLRLLFRRRPLLLAAARPSSWCCRPNHILTVLLSLGKKQVFVAFCFSVNSRHFL